MLPPSVQFTTLTLCYKNSLAGYEKYFFLLICKEVVAFERVIWHVTFV